ncbi:MAG TPA: sulfite exporter TauE/SafE family protein [Acidimicrobiales bacterium]|nr:sulfite exporter TauE/SafE family protein [Acidimicrobiales bacterium]
MTDTVPAALAVAAGAAAQAVIGIGFALVCAPFLVALEGGREGVRTAVLLSGVLNLAMLVRHRREARPKDALWLLVPALAVTPLFAAGVRRLPARSLEVAAGVVTLTAVAVLAVGVRVRAARGRVGAVGAGVVSAATNVVAGIGGPPVAMWAVNADWPPREARATFQLYFLCLNAVALAGLGLPSPAPVLFAAMGAGWAVGAALDRYVSDRAARAGVLALAAAGAVIALV